MKKLIVYGMWLTAMAVLAEGEHFEPSSTGQLNNFYSAPRRNIAINIQTLQKLHAIKPGFLGINLSYFNTTDEIWQRYGFLGKLKKARVGALRYPGGEETSFFHWKHPGVNGYEDLWDNPAAHGNSPERGRFQPIWVAPEKWDANTDFMDFDEFMATCIALGAEPIVGLNLSSGRKHGRQADGIAEALDWMRYCKRKGYRVKYWFLDNEPWNREAAYQFNLVEYAEESLAYGTAIKKEFPAAKLIANPAACSNLHADQIEKFMRIAGGVVDHIDIHWYWAWGKGSFEHWLAHTPLTDDDKWKKSGEIRTYAEGAALIRSASAKAGFPDIGIVVLEWNIAPSNWTQTFNPSLISIIQAELLMEFAAADIELTCLWPLIWQTSRNVWSEQDTFPSIVASDPPFDETLSLEMFRLFSAIVGKQLVKADTPNDDVVVLASVDTLYVISKSALRRKVTIDYDVPIKGTATGEMIGMKHQVVKSIDIQTMNRKLYFFAEPYSFTAIRIEK